MSWRSDNESKSTNDNACSDFNFLTRLKKIAIEKPQVLIDVSEEAFESYNLQK
jgi:hypothetical protein